MSISGASREPAVHYLPGSNPAALVDDAAERATSILSQSRDDLDRLTKLLLEHETLAGAELGDAWASLALSPSPRDHAPRRVTSRSAVR